MLDAAAHASGQLPATADTAHDVPAAFVAGALIGVATDWLRRRCPTHADGNDHADQATPAGLAAGTHAQPTP
jgi:hypothetical protein